MVDSPPLSVSRAPSRRRGPSRAEFRKTRRAEERIDLMGQKIDMVKPEEVLHHTEQWIAEGRKALVANHNLNSIYLVRRHPEMRAFFDRADLIELDSIPLMHFARMLGLNSKPFHRCTYLDWRDHFWSLVDRNGWRVMYVGGTREVLDTAIERLGARYPGAAISGHDGYFDVETGSSENQAVLAEIAATKPHILFVGMGMPRQELWIQRNLAALPNCVIFSVGAAFDYEAGAQKCAPRWMGRMGIEWLYRLAADPRRLARRYLVDPWSLLDLAWIDFANAAGRRFQKPRP